MKKQYIIEWAIALVVLTLIVPFIIVKASTDDTLFTWFRYNIRYFSPLVIIGLAVSQWIRSSRRKKAVEAGQGSS